MKIALIGYGKMGKAIETAAHETGHEIVLRISSANRHDLNKTALKQADVAIEFTNPEAAFKNVLFCLQNQVPVVCGSTGWLQKLPEAEQVCREQNSALLVSSNFSIGVNIFFEINRKLAQLMNAQNQYGVQIEEIHHTQKKDAPSGTAISLAEQIIENIHRVNTWVNDKEPLPGELLIRSERTDAVPGTHRVHYRSSIDDIEIIHTAHNREGFARGAVAAAAYIYKRSGVFSMRDVLGL
jgi:4-hydroxy-tetrahydrodipicolinate reductase